MSDSPRPNDDQQAASFAQPTADSVGKASVHPMLAMDDEANTRVTEKPPPGPGGPMKRKKKLERSLVDLSCSAKSEEKRQKISDDRSGGAAAKKPIPSMATEVTDSPSTRAGSAKAKELQNHTMFKLRRKKEETNAALVQKLNAYTEQLRLEVSNLKTALVSEKNAVRALRAQHDAVARKMKLEAKHTKGAIKKVPAVPAVVELEQQKNGQTTKLVNQIAVLKDQNKSLEGKVQVCSNAEKKKISDIREIKEAYDARLTQVTKSAKLEISRLLEEIKTKEKTIQLMKKDNLHQKKDVPTKKQPNMRKDSEKATLSSPVVPKSTTARQSHDNADSPSCANEDVAPMNLKNGSEQIDGLNLQLEFVQTENEILKSELGIAQEQIETLKTSLANTKGDGKSIYERIKELEYKESELLKEAHELREQNDLLEFRIVELEESHDKWSLRSQSQSTTHTRDVWTDTEKEPDDMMMLSDRSDSGVTSPHSNHQSEDRLSMPSPCDLTMIDNIPSDDIRKRVLTMTKRSCYDEEDKICLMQILSLLNNLEALSQDHEISGEFSSLDSMASKQLQQTAISKNRIVATVQPYTESAFYEEPITPQLKNGRMTNSTNKVMLWTSLQESGVFEESMVINQATQTQTEEFPLAERLSGDLTAEIQKLNKFRERIEEVVGNNKSAGKLLSPDQRKLEFYKERAETLESKLMIYESSEDIQLRKLSERLQREVQLESLSKQLQQQIAELEKTNQILDEERCEFEEAENDTRLKFQRLEVDFEMVTQRNVELEMSEEALQMKLQEAKTQLAIFEEKVHQLETRIEELVKANKETDTQQSLTSTVEEQLRSQVVEMHKRELSMQQNLDELKRAYNETLENADNVWAEMENEYKTKLKECEMNEIGLQSKLQQLEERIDKDSQFAQERLMQMEELEMCMKQRIGSLNRDNKDLTAKYSSLLDEFNCLKEEYQQLKGYMSGPAAEILERERRKIVVLEEELQHATKMLKQMEAKNKDNAISLKLRMSAAIKELENIRITNNELQEEVVTLEARIMEAKRMQSIDEETIRHLTEELRLKQKQLNNNYQSAVYRSSEPTLAQELASTFLPISPNQNMPKLSVNDDQSPQKGTKRLADSVLELNGKPKLLPKPEDIGRLLIKTRDA